MMSKRFLMLIIILAAVLLLYFYSSARQGVSLPPAEDITGQSASAFVPTESKGKPTAKGSSSLKVTGPVWVEK